VVVSTSVMGARHSRPSPGGQRRGCR
jgi:hypothetical protein